MTARALAASAAICAALVALSAIFLDMSLERAIVLAPVIVVTAGVTVALVLLWVRIAWASLRGGRDPK